MRRNSLIRVTTGALSVAMLFNLVGVFPANAATEYWNDASTESASWSAYKDLWEETSGNYEHVSLTPGTDESKLNFAWYSHTMETPKVRIGINKEDMENAKEYKGTGTAITLKGLEDYYSNKVTVSDLKENTKYYYQIFQNNAWQEVEEYTTKSFDNYSFLYVGDPQIGASKGQTSTEGDKMAEGSSTLADGTAAVSDLAARNDSYNWNATLENALANHPDVSFMVSAGDQVNTASNEAEYAGYLGAEALTSLPVATTIGNHDSKSSQYSLHYNNPNTFDESQTDYVNGSTVAGTDYYYRYGDVLFIVLDTNNYNCATHENVIKKAVEENEDAKWRIVTFHQDIYGSGLDHSDSDGIILRTQLTPIMDAYDIDVVLQGHDHTYSRTYQLSSDGKTHESYSKENISTVDQETYLAENNCYTLNTSAGTENEGSVVNPEGTVYFEANSATGSKFYNLIASQQDYIAERSQTWSPSYSVVNVTETALSVTTYDAKTGAVMEGSSTYTIVKEADKTTLKADVNNALDKLANVEEYTSDSLEKLEQVVKSAQNILENVNASDEEIAASATALSEKVAALTVKAEQKIEGENAYSKTTVDNSFALNAKAVGALSYRSDNESVAVVSSNGTVAITGAGTANITVSAAKTDTLKATSKTIRLTVSAAVQTPEATQSTILETTDNTSTASKMTVKKVTGVKISSVKSKTLKVSFKKLSNISGYEVSYSSNKTFNKNVNVYNVKKTASSKTIKKLKKNAVYYVRVRAYKKAANETIYGSYSKVKKITVK